MALTGWDSTKKYSVTIAAADVPTDEIDFPFLLNLSISSGLSALDVSAIFTDLGANSLKIAVEDGDTGNQCYVEIDTWDDVNLSAQLWVKIPAISSTVDTVINFYYDSAQADNATYVGTTTTVPAQNVWNSGFAAVYHMSQDPSGTAPQILDSTANGNHGTTYGTMTSADLVAGLVGRAIQFDGVDDYIVVPVNVLATATDWTGEYYINSTYSGADGQAHLWWSSNVYGFGLYYYGAYLAYWFGGSWYQEAVASVYDGNWHYNTNKYDSAATTSYHIFDTTAEVAKASFGGTWPGTDFSIGRRQDGLNYMIGVIDEIRLSSVVRSAGWLAITNLSNRDQLGTWLFAGVASLNLRQTIDQVFGISADLRQIIDQVFALKTRQIIDQVFGISADLRQIIDQVFALKIRQIIDQQLGDAPVMRQTIYQIFGDMRQVRRAWLQPFGDAIAIRKTLEQVFSIPGLLRLVIQQDFAITASALRLITDQVWSIQDIEILRQTIYQIFSIAGSSGSSLQYTVSCTINGISVPSPAGITVERDINLYYIDVSLQIAGQPHWARYDYGADLTITINGQAYVLVIVTPKRNRRHGGGSYMVDAASPAIRLGAQFSEPITGELIGMASQIASSLAPGFVIDWQIHDEFYGPGKLIAAGEYPIEIIRKMALALKAIVQSNPDGSLKIMYRRPVHVDQWQDAPVDYILSDADDFYTASETPAHRHGYNKYTVRNQIESSDTLRMEAKSLSAESQEVRGYQTPWTGNFNLTHTGGGWVSIKPMGIEERAVTETIEFINGNSRTAYPIYGYTAAVWQEINLGTITISEDGAIESAIAAESLLDITYTTKCRLWQVLDARTEDLQLVSEVQS